MGKKTTFAAGFGVGALVTAGLAYVNARFGITDKISDGIRQAGEALARRAAANSTKTEKSEEAKGED